MAQTHPDDEPIAIDDVAAANKGRDARVPATVQSAVFQLKTFGICILRNVFLPRAVPELLNCAARHAAMIEAKAIAGDSNFDFDETFLFNAKNLGCELTAIDPWTSGERSADFAATSLYPAVMSNFVRAVPRSIIGIEAYWAYAKVRLVLPANDGKSHGRLPLHTERSQIDKLAGLYNIWGSLGR